MTMNDWIVKLDDFIRISDRQILTHAGTISHEAAQRKAEAELARFRAAQDALPHAVDEHFAATIEELKRLEAVAKSGKSPVKKAAKERPSRPGKPKEGGCVIGGGVREIAVEFTSSVASDAWAEEIALRPRFRAKCYCIAGEALLRCGRG